MRRAPSRQGISMVLISFEVMESSPLRARRYAYDNVLYHIRTQIKREVAESDSVLEQ
jgi:hypothetical protein